MGIRRTDADWMGTALALARRGLGETWPNPSVGCVLVKEGRIVGRGRTQKGGRPHAEVMALSQAGPEAKGSTAYVTLEPCSHQGKSPPCTDALIAANVARVVIAQNDPNPKVDGLAALRSHGIEVQTGVCQAEAAVLNEGFVSTIKTGRPFVQLKLATTLDGKIATKTGESRWITGPEARKHVHLMRAQSDAVLVGRGTAQADDPMLDVRGLGELRNPVRIVIDRALSLPQETRLLTTASDELPTWIIHGPDAQPSQAYKSCKLIEAADLADGLRKLATEGLTRIMCEGGATLAASLIQANLVDEIVAFTAGKAIGNDGTDAIGSLGVSAIKDAVQFEQVHSNRIGHDLMTVWRPGSEG